MFPLCKGSFFGSGREHILALIMEGKDICNLNRAPHKHAPTPPRKQTVNK